LDFQSRINDNDGRGRLIHDYWKDGPRLTLPSGIMIEIALEVIKLKCYDLGEAAKLIFLVAAAGHDAGIAAWAAKRLYDTARPSSFIPAFYLGKAINNQLRGPYCPSGTIDGALWKAYEPLNFLVPPFPEYVSGHSTFGRAQADVLTAFTGSPNVPLVGGFTFTFIRGSSFLEPFCSASGIDVFGRSCQFKKCAVDPAFDSSNFFFPKSTLQLGPWRTYNELGDESGISRLWSGVHIGPGNEQGLALGSRVAVKVIAKATKLFSGVSVVERLPGDSTAGVSAPHVVKPDLAAPPLVVKPAPKPVDSAPGIKSLASDPAALAAYIHDLLKTKKFPFTL